MKELKWISADIRPGTGLALACIITRTDGTIKYDNFGDGPYWWNGYEFVGQNDWGDEEIHSVDYWMPWADFWEMLESLPRIVNNKENEKTGSTSSSYTENSKED